MKLSKNINFFLTGTLNKIFKINFAGKGQKKKKKKKKAIKINFQQAGS